MPISVKLKRNGYGCDQCLCADHAEPNRRLRFVMIPRSDVIELDMKVDDGLKMLMSMGRLYPMPVQRLLQPK